jgi:hypothetical protein
VAVLDVTDVSRSLDRKTTILWLEIADIFALVTICSLLNLLFGGTSLKMYLVYAPTFLLAVTLIAAKRGRPENFLFHYLSYQLRPKALSCFGLGAPEYLYTGAVFQRRGDR